MEEDDTAIVDSSGMRLRSTLDVIMSFMQYDARGEPDASRIFSRECYNTWLETRKTQLQNPEQAFHRVFLTHLRGTDTRRPFSPDIEAAILRILRDETNRCKNPWDGCFADSGNKLNVGRHGFRQLAFHEKRKLDGKSNCAEFRDSPLSRNNNNSSKSSLREKRSKSKSSNSSDTDPAKNILRLVTEEEIAETFDLKFSSESERDDLNNLETINRSSSSSIPMEPSLELQLSADISYRSVTEYSHEDRLTPWDHLWEAMSTYNQPNFLNDFLAYATQQQIASDPQLQIDFLPPAVVWFLKQKIPSGDIRYHASFLFPTGEDKEFLPDRPIGTYIVEPKGSRIVDADDTAKQMLQLPLVGDFAFAHTGSLFELWLCMPEFIRVMSGRQEFIRRLLFRTGSGQVKLLLMRGPVDGGMRTCKFQDISDKFPEVVSRPFFI